MLDLYTQRGIVASVGAAGRLPAAPRNFLRAAEFPCVPDSAAPPKTLPFPEEKHMCYPVECPKCHKTTWGGCGMHVDQVMAMVPKERQCTCQASAPQPKSGIFSIFG